MAEGLTSREQKLDTCVRRIAREEGVPPFCNNANEVITRTLDLHGGSSWALAGLVMKDLGLTSQILRAANSALFNRSGRPILSVPHGIVLLGWDRLRNLVTSIRYVEHYASRSPGLREVMLLSLLSAVHSRDIAVAIGYPNPEEAHICGLFRNLGEVLIGCHCPEEYSKIIVTMQAEHIRERAACLRVMDFSWDEVGLRVASGWNMPPKVYACLRGLGGQMGSPLDRCLASITEYARDLTHAVYRNGAPLDAVRLPWIVDPHGKPTVVPARAVRRAADSALAETRATFAALGTESDRLRLEKQAERARGILATMPVFGAEGLRALEHAAEEARRAALRQNFELTAVISTLLDAVHGAGFDEAVFGLLNDDQTVVRGRLARGGLAEEALSRFNFPIDRPDAPIRDALNRRGDVLVDCSRDGRYDKSALVSSMGPTAFALFPIVVGHRSVGCLYAGRRAPAPDLEAARGSLSRVRDAMAAVIGEARQATRERTAEPRLSSPSRR